MRKYVLGFALLSFVFLVSCSEEEEVIQQDGAVGFGGVPLANARPEARSCEATNPLVGQTSALRVSSLYGISGNVTILSDCEIQLTNFNYNGRGPNVSIYGAANGDFGSGVNMSEVLNGRVWENATLNLFVPEGTSIGDINSFSVWCFQFDVDFSSAFFE